ncbi:MAG TPA: hypothetical protein VLC95_08495, partial [Anaerolineae bacterium]|nr:hypothetical protein [Anaerolineae bacterium]
MDREGFHQLLRERGVPDDQIGARIALAERFEAFAAGRPTADDARAFAALLVEEGTNSWDNLITIARYGWFTRNDPVYVAIVELVDGAEVLDRLYEKLGQAVGAQMRDEVFANIDFPPLGTPSSAKPSVTQAVMARLEQLVDRDTCRRILSGGLRDLEDEWYLAEREKYRECGTIDAYLARKGDDYIAQLQKHRDEGTLYFTQPVTDAVIDWVDRHPEVRQGVREGNVVYEAKVPYMAAEYLATTDERLKRYYYCHCPWVRESIRSGDVRVSPTFCLCSAGFQKK